MRHLTTHVCDDVRQEVGNKLSLMGLYDEALVVSRFPVRLPKLTIFQQWDQAARAQHIRVEIKGSALPGILRIDGIVERVEGEPPKEKLQIVLAFAPVELIGEGTLEIATFFEDNQRPAYVRELQVRQGPAER